MECYDLLLEYHNAPYQWRAIFSMVHEQATSEDTFDPGKLIFPALTLGTFQCRDLLASPAWGSPGLWPNGQSMPVLGKMGH